MLSTQLQTILDNRLRYLPEITGKAINSIDWSTKVIEIGHKYGLHMDEIEELQAVVLKSMVGLASPADFETNLITATAASPSVIEKILSDLNVQIFEPIHQFVIGNGKVPDPLLAHGIELEPDLPTPEPLSTTVPAPHSAQEIEIPASPEPHPQKPQVSSTPNAFDSFFVKTPTKTDHSMLK